PAVVAEPDPTRGPGVVEAPMVGHAAALEEVRIHLYPRLRWAADLPGPVPSYAARPLPGVVELAAIDHPTHVTDLLSNEGVEQLGGWPTARRTAMANLRALPALHQDAIHAAPGRDDSVVHVLTSSDHFGASRVLMLPEVLEELGLEPPAHGVLVAVPNHQLLALHPVVGAGTVAALQLLVRISTGEHDRHPGPLSRHVYFVPASGAGAERVTSFGDDGTLTVEVAGALAEAFAALGILSP
ncbi:MAG: hypothetical protein WB471_16250, partial [Nocardioides sp.]